MAAGGRGPGGRTRRGSPMNLHAHAEVDLMPPAFVRGPRRLVPRRRHAGEPDLCRRRTPGWRRGTADFGTCLELRTTGPVARLRYMGEVPLLAGALRRGGGAAEGGARAAAAGADRGLAGRRAGAGRGGLPPPGRRWRWRGTRRWPSSALSSAARRGTGWTWSGTCGCFTPMWGSTCWGRSGRWSDREPRGRDVTRRFTPQGRVLPGFEDLSS